MVKNDGMSKDTAGTVLKVVEKAMEQCLLSAQGICGYRKDDSEVPDTVIERITRLSLEYNSLRIGRIVMALKEVRRHLWLLSEEEESEETIHRVLGHVGRLTPMIAQIRASTARFLSELVVYHRATCKLHYVTLRVYRTLSLKGLCSDKVEEGDGDGDDEGDASGMTFENDVEGTGMGGGEGQRDVTDQIEDEEQLLGLKGDEENDAGEKKENETLKGEERNKGMEMSNDFEGDMHDVEDEEEKDDGEGEDEGQVELEREMGELDEADVVDEKMWGSDDEDEEGKEKDQGFEKFEKDSKVKGRSQDDEMVTRDDDDEAPQKENQETEEDEGPKKEEGKPESMMEEEEGDDQGEINEDTEDGYEEKHGDVDVRAPDASDLPEDMELDGNENEERNDEGGNEQGQDDSPNDDVDEENVDLDLPPVEEDGMDEENGTLDGHEEEGQEKTGDIDPLKEDGGGEKPQGEEAMPDEERPPSSQYDDGTKTEARNAFGLQYAKGDRSMAASLSKTQELEGEEQSNRNRSMEEAAEAEKEAEEAVDEDDRPEGEAGTGAQTSQGGDQGADWKYAGGKSQERPPDNGEAQKRRLEAPNPFQEAGSALEHWHRRLDVLRSTAMEEDEPEAKEESNDPTLRSEEGSQPLPDSMDSSKKFEYVPRGDTGASAQVLGAVPDEKSAAMIQSSDAMEMDEPLNNNDDGADSTMPPDDGALEKEDVSKSMDPDSGEVEPHEKYDSDRPPQQTVSQKPQAGGGVVDEQGVDEGQSMDVEDQIDVQEKDRLAAEDDELTRRGALVTTNQNLLHPPAHEKGMEEEEEQEAMPMVPLWEEVEPADVSAGRELWNRYRMLSYPLAQRLCEQLRLVLEPMVATKLQGDYRTGKRINMKRVISYIASGFRKDKIWLRRTKPAKRAYQVLLAIDDSSSMRHFKAEDMALTALATLVTGMTTLEIGEVAVASFGKSLCILNDFGQPFTEESGPKVTSSFTFRQESTDGAAMLRGVIEALERARATAGLDRSDKTMQLVFVISDGSFERGDKTQLRRLVREMAEQGQLLVLLIVDHSIVDRQEVEYGTSGVKINRYLDSYPFPYYIVLDNVEVLPEVMADALRQWFELLQRVVSEK